MKINLFCYKFPEKVANIFVIRKLTAMIEKEGNGYIVLCPEVDIASQGNTAGALDLFFATASPQEIACRIMPA